MRVLFLFFSLCITNIFCDYRRSRGSICTGYSFRCLNGECIPSTSVCDGESDCGDGSDERHGLCMEYASLCPPYAFRCAYGACVDKFKTCDGKRNCADNSDELLPHCFNASSIVKKCKLYEFQCDSGQCINDTSLCDGKRDCVDGSDETITQCVNFKCPGFGFQCAYGGCINKIDTCNFKEDCKDGSDEDAEVCGRKTIQQTPRPIVHRLILIDSGCQLPSKPKNGKYEVTDCIGGDVSAKCRNIPGTIVDSKVTIKYSCDPGYVLSEESNPILCLHGTWNPEPPTCQKLCKGLHLYWLDLKCHYRDKEVNCAQPVRPGTKVEVKCKDYYHNPDSFSTTQCLADGTWADKLYKCYPDCGIRNMVSKGVPLISNGSTVKMSEYPWHAGFYLIEGERIVYKCGGTIIHPKAVLTAAHCVYEDETMSKRDKRKIRVAVGKYWSDWNHKGDYNTQQTFKVIDIYIPKRYRGRASGFEGDIAILHLDRLMILMPAVMPICLDRGNSFRLDQSWNRIGTVVGSGAETAGGPVAEELRVARFPVLAINSCQEFNSSHLTHDKFCAGLSNGTSVMEGDSGSGMTFPMLTYGIEQHFIYGIVSYRPSGREDVAAFTNVKVHMSWIEEMLDKIEKSLKIL